MTTSAPTNIANHNQNNNNNNSNGTTNTNTIDSCNDNNNNHSLNHITDSNNSNNSDIIAINQQQQQHHNHHHPPHQLHSAATPAATTTASTTTPTTPTQYAAMSPTSLAVANVNASVSVNVGIAASSINSTRAMQSDEDFNIRFVNLVRIHKCLYDKKVPEYRNRDNQEKAWMLISQETRESVIHCKERWRNLRACLSRYIKQQSGSEPQHKPYYLAEHMAFLLPFLKSTRNNPQDAIISNGGTNSLSGLFQISQHQLQHHHHTLNQMHLLGHPSHVYIYGNGNGNDDNGIGGIGGGGDPKLEMKHSISENDDEETIDAFDPAVAASLQMHQRLPLSGNGIGNSNSNNNNNNSGSISSQNHNGQRISSPLSDTASANTELQNFIPDVQISELPSAAIDGHRRQSSDYAGGPEPKRIKTECEATTTAHMSGGLYGSCDNSDMEFFRSILPDIAALTPQQKRKFKIGILELIDDVAERYPAERTNGITIATTTTTAATSSTNYRRSSARDWRK